MKMSKLEELMQGQNVEPEILEAINSYIATKEKIRNLTEYVEQYKEEVMNYMIANNLEIIYANKGIARYRVADKTSIKKDKVLAFLDKLNCGEVSTGSIEDVSETKSSESLGIKGFKEVTMD